ncbi:endolytic transglycosylase MltG [Conservatibacter flavescens]|uniref:Endolytic murein transglycosylase n=1 Tax=Conservatibacter flavescens TaxID=28161 RepID=A0A2M8S1Z5_9PAST|nr:endolytic transglycosylase MltG [Conservatibacter flavescens]PJG85116.1 endolytic transglycosylase MltG [Conservatibacter flavescens]
MKKFFAFLFVLCLMTVGVGIYGWQQLNQFIQSELPSHTAGSLLTVEKGTGSQKLAQQLETKGLIQQSYLLPWVLKLKPEYNKVKAGTYRLDNIKTVHDLLTLLNSGKEAQFAIRFTDGETYAQVKKNLQNAPHLVQSLANKSEAEIFTQLSIEAGFPHIPQLDEQKKLEGWIYPDTYHYTPNSTDFDLLKRAAIRTVQALEKAWAQRDPNTPLKNQYELLILASIIEKETAINAERGKVASVFINRLNKNMLLQTDPTVIYGMGESYQGNIRKKDLETPTPYNTYVISGLPPTPIAMPSEASMLAAAKPEKTDFLYFVADGTGGHKFSKTLTEHNRAVQEYLRWYRENHKK